MPAKQKRGHVTAKSGVARDFLQETFGSFPVSGDHVKIGHILHVYMTSAEFSRAECDRLLRSIIQTQFGITTERSYKADIQRIVSSTIQKYRSLRNPEEFRKFRIECEKPFDVRLARDTPESLHRSVDDDASDDAKKIPAIFSGDSSEPGPSEVGGEATAESGVSPVVGT